MTLRTQKEQVTKSGDNSAVVFAAVVVVCLTMVVIVVYAIWHAAHGGGFWV